MVLVSVVSSSRRCIDWITRDMGRIFPAEWERFRDGVPEAERDGNLAARTPGCPRPRPRGQGPGGSGVVRVEGHPRRHGAGLHAEPALSGPGVRGSASHSRARDALLELWCVPAEGQIITMTGKLAAIPGVLIHGASTSAGPPTSRGSWPRGSRTPSWSSSTTPVMAPGAIRSSRRSTGSPVAGELSPRGRGDISGQRFSDGGRVREGGVGPPFPWSQGTGPSVSRLRPVKG